MQKSYPKIANMPPVENKVFLNAALRLPQVYIAKILIEIIAGQLCGWRSFNVPTSAPG